MSKVKRQHYIPQFYLRNFADKGETLYVFDKELMKSFKASIINIGQEKHFYNTNSQDAEFLRSEVLQNPSKYVEEVKEYILKNRADDPLLIDRFFKASDSSDIEKRVIEIATNPEFLETRVLAPHDGRSATVIKEVIREIRVRNRIKQHHKRDLAFMMAVQFVRTPKYRHEAIDFQEKLINRLIQDGVFPGKEDGIRVTYNRAFADRITSEFLTDTAFVPKLTEILLGHIWIIGINSTPQPLYTSDAPIVKRGHLTDVNPSVGFASTGVEIAYPLTSHIIITMFERTAFQHEAQFDTRCKSLNEDNVAYYNTLQVAQSRRQIYCSDDNFTLAFDLCKRNPELREKDRTNVQFM